MTSEQKHVQEWMVKAQQDTPDRPVWPEFAVRKLRVNLIAEELTELCEAFGLKICVDTRRGKKAHIEVIENEQKPALTREDYIEAYDGVCDLMVVVLGTGVAMGCEVKPGFDEVMDSNDSKFIDGRRADGKWEKGPSYRKANLGPILDAQIIAAQEHDKQQALPTFSQP